MSEEIKNNEMKDEELEQVTGGRGADAVGDNTPLTALDKLKGASSTAIYGSRGGN